MRCMCTRFYRAVRNTRASHSRCVCVRVHSYARELTLSHMFAFIMMIIIVIFVRFLKATDLVE